MNGKCLCKNPDGTICGLVYPKTSLSSHIYGHVDANGNPLRSMKLGETHEWTEEPVNKKVYNEGYTPKKKRKYTKRDEKAAGLSDVIDVPCILRINILTGKKTIILGGNET